MKEEKHLIVIGGATGSGKTEMAIAVARHYGCEIISADSRQFYRGMDIGTAKVKSEVPQHFIDFLEPDQDYSAGDFERDVTNFLNEYFKTHNYCILCGGSTLYIQAVCEGLDEFPAVEESVKLQVENLYLEEGIEGLKKQLKILDPEYYEVVDLSNPQRVMRALGVCYASGKPFSFFRKKNTRQRPYEIHYFWLGWPRKKLYERIEKRVDQMLEQGWVEEVKKLLQYKECTALNTVGYKEIIAYLEGKLGWEEMKNEIKIQTRRYAKRQYTWMRRDGFWITLSPLDFEFIPQYLKCNVDFKKFTLSEYESEYFYLNNGTKKISVVAKKAKHHIALKISEMNAEKEIQLLFCSFLAGDLYFEEYCGELPDIWKNYFINNGFRCVD